MPKDNTHYKHQEEMESQDEKKPELHTPAVITIDEKHDLVSYEYGWFFRDRTTQSGNTNKYFSTLVQACKFLAEKQMQRLSSGTVLTLVEAAELMESATRDMTKILSADKALHFPGSDK
jgi:hypothetical protein